MGAGMLTDELVAFCAAFGSERAQSPALATTVDTSAWNVLLPALVEQRISAMALAACEAGALQISDSALSELHVAVARSATAMLALEHLLLDVVDAFGQAGIEYRVLKGPAVARLDYTNPGVREFGDIDVLVRGSDFDGAAELLSRRGCVRRYREPRPGFTARFGKAACFVTPRGNEIDLHRSFVAGPYAGIGDHPDLWHDPDGFRVGGVEVLALSRQWRMLGAAMHAVLGRRVPRLVPLRDVAELSDRLDHHAAIAHADELGMAAVVARAVLTTDAVLNLDRDTPLHAWAFAFEPTGRERRDIDAYTNEHRSYAGQVRSGWRAVAGPQAKVAYARDLLLPDRTYLKERDGGYVARMLRALRRDAT